MTEESTAPATPEIKTDGPPMDVIEACFGIIPETKKNMWTKVGKGWINKCVSYNHPIHLEEGSLIGPSSCFGAGVRIGKGTIVKGNCAFGNNISIGDGCSIEDHVSVHTGVVIGNNCLVGEKAKIYRGVKIGDNSVIPSGRVVSDSSKVIQKYTLGRTQKSIGINALLSRGFNTPEFSLTPIEDFFDKPDNVNSLVNKFVRPCPVSPRHGFVDSRPINTPEEAIKIINETREADPRAELLAMPFISAEYSGIWTPGSLIMGPSNDGATSGNKSVTIPVLGVPRNFGWQATLKDAGITESPYLEMLFKSKYLPTAGYSDPGVEYETMYVQLRNGPQVPAEVDFIPKTMKVKHVVLAEGDLLEWEDKVKRFAPGTVVYHPGGSLASHYAVHAFLNKVPVITSRKPEIGDALLKTKKETKEFDLDKIRAGFIVGCRTKMTRASAARVMLSGCHSTTQWGGCADLALGMAMGCIYRLTLTAAIGEARHEKSRKGPKKDRYSVYAVVWDRILQTNTKLRYLDALYKFEFGRWGGCGVGGENWLNLSRWAGRIFNALIDGNIKTALECLNKGVNAVHNNGWAFNKFVSKLEMDVAVKNPLIPTLQIAPYLYQAMNSDVELLNKWWVGRKKIKVDHDVETDEEEPVNLHKGSESCECGKINCDKCYPDGWGCGNCQEHGCNQCNLPCTCSVKKCHDCGYCENCHKAYLDRMSKASITVKKESWATPGLMIYSSLDHKQGNIYAFGNLDIDVIDQCLVENPLTVIPSVKAMGGDVIVPVLNNDQGEVVIFKAAPKATYNTYNIHPDMLKTYAELDTLLTQTNTADEAEKPEE